MQVVVEWFLRGIWLLLSALSHTTIAFIELAFFSHKTILNYERTPTKESQDFLTIFFRRLLQHGAYVRTFTGYIGILTVCSFYIT